MGEEEKLSWEATNCERIFLQNLTEEMADYCVNRMRPYTDPNTKQPVTGALDYMDFTRTLFQN